MEAPNYDVFIDQMLPRGGLRRQRHDAELPRTQARSQLAQLLLEQWAWGEIGAQRVQAIANASVADGAHHPEVLQLAGIGNKGQCPGNCHRDLLRILASKVVMPSTVGMTVPLKVQDEVEMLDLPMMPMHRMVAHMHSHFPLEFGRRFAGPPGAIAGFWSQVKATDPKWLAWQHALEVKPAFRSHCVPLALHGDGVPVFKGKSLYIVSGASLLASGPSIDQKLLITCYWGHLANKDKANKTLDTEDQVWRYIQWDLLALWSGLHPTTDPDGQPWARGTAEASAAGKPLAGGFCAVPWIIKGDLEYYSNVLGLEHWASRDRPCFCCKVDRDANPWTDHRLLGAPHLQWDANEWRASHPNVHRVFSTMCIGPWSPALDILHTVSLGVAQHIAGNILFELVWHCLKHGPLTHRVKEIWAGIKEFYNVTGAETQLSNLTLSMFTDPKKPHRTYPHLSAKAKETEWVCRSLAFVWPQYMDQGNRVHLHMAKTLQCLLQVYDIAGAPGLFHSNVDSQLLLDQVQALQAHYNWLAKWAEDNGLRRWNTVLKHHYMGHLAEQAQWLHCRAGATYLDEDYMGRIKNVAKRASGGGLRLTTAIVMAKYIRGTWLRWAASRDSGTLVA